MSSNRNATINVGIAAVNEWQRGSTAELDQFERTYLTAKGQQKMQNLIRTMSQDTVRRLVTQAVDSGY